MTKKKLTKRSRRMTPYLATGISEGFEESRSEAEVKKAWQYLVDTGMVWSLQGWFGRQAMHLIEIGYIKAPKKQQRDYWGNIIKFPNGRKR